MGAMRWRTVVAHRQQGCRRLSGSSPNVVFAREDNRGGTTIDRSQV
jgi:hypothetical protein